MSRRCLSYLRIASRSVDREGSSQNPRRPSREVPFGAPLDQKALLLPPHWTAKFSSKGKLRFRSPTATSVRELTPTEGGAGRFVDLILFSTWADPSNEQRILENVRTATPPDCQACSQCDESTRRRYYAPHALPKLMYAGTKEKHPQ
jgi:hypothetical protein